MNEYRVMSAALALMLMSGCTAIENVPDVTYAGTFADTESETFTEETALHESEAMTVETEAVTAESITVSETANDAVLSEFSVPASDEYAKLSGRTVFDGNTRWLGYTCSSASFVFTGTKARVTLVPEVYDDEAELPFFMITVNGGEVVKQVLSERQTFDVFSSDVPAECEVTITKLSEAAFSSIGIESIDTVSYDACRPSADRKMKIEFIGDSLTCGYGVLADGPNVPFSTADEDGTKAYASLTAERLGADYSIIAMNGIGVLSRYSPKHEKNTDGVLMPELYRYADMFRSPDIMWDSGGFQPDICVIALGANDNSYTSGIPEREAEFSEAYRSFIGEVRAENPYAYILCVSGIQQSNLADVIEAAQAVYSADTGDKNIGFFRFGPQMESEGYGSDYHPSAVSQQRFSDELYDKITEIMKGE